MNKIYFQLIAATLLTLASRPVSAQEIREGVPQRPTAVVTNLQTGVVTTNEQNGVGVGGIEVNADQLEYFQTQQLIIGRGHVVIIRAQQRMMADFVKVHTDTQVAEARGNVILDRQGTVWRGEDLVYNFKTQQGEFGTFVAYYEPFFVRADDSQRVSTNEFLLHNATFTTCDGDDPKFYMRSNEARILDGTTLKAYSVVPYLYGVPFFWLPYWKRSLDPEDVTFYIEPGYSSHWGAFALTGYGFRLADNLRAVTHVDVRSMRGVGLGEDLHWKDPAPDIRVTFTNTIEVTNMVVTPQGTNMVLATTNQIRQTTYKDKKYEGMFSAYYVNDPNPFLHEYEDRTGMVTDQRYRLKLQDSRALTTNDSSLVDLNYLSDPYVLEDFLDDEFQAGVQPENRVSLMHNGGTYSAGLLANVRLNDFFQNINRLPEADLNVNQTELGDTPFYYESQNSAAFLQSVYPTTNGTPTAANYSAFRLDTTHTLYYPTRSFDFLSIIPRAVYDGTFYSKTYTTMTTTNVTVLTNMVVTPQGTNMVLATTNQVTQTVLNNGSGLRNLPQLGVETSFKAFKVLSDEPTGIGRDVGLRHIAEPYANYTYQPTPNLEPDELPQFDAVDQLTMQHNLQLGLINQLQTKRRGYPENLIDANVYTYWEIEKPAGSNDFSDVYTVTRVRPTDWLMMDFDAAYNPYTSQFDKFNTQIAILAEDESRLSLEYLYTENSQDQIATELMLFPRDHWSFKFYCRYDIANSQMQEHSYLLQHKNDCYGIGLGLRRLENETIVYCQLWLSAFPQMIANLGGGGTP